MKLKDLLENEELSVEAMGKEISKRLSNERCFRNFSYSQEFNHVYSKDELNDWLEQLYDFADLHRIWIQ